VPVPRFSSRPTLVERVTRRSGYLLAAALIAAYALIAIKGPQGIETLLEKRREIRQLQEQNAAAAHANQLRKERIKRLEDSQSEQEMEIRKQLRLLRPGETTFILPETPKDAPKTPNTGPPPGPKP